MLIPSFHIRRITVGLLAFNAIVDRLVVRPQQLAEMAGLYGKSPFPPGFSLITPFMSVSSQSQALS